MRSLRRYIKLVLESSLIDADEMQKNNSGSMMRSLSNSEVKDALVEAMRKLNLQLIPRGEGFGFLGSGAYGWVFEVLHDGERKALKITGSSKDAKQYKHVQQIRAGLPAIPKAALPRIDVQIKVGQYYATVMEFLNETSPTTRMSISNLFSTWAHGGKGITKGLMAKLSSEFAAKLDGIFLDMMDDKDIAQKIMSTRTWNDLKDDISSGEYYPGESEDPIFQNGDDLIYTAFIPFQEHVDIDKIIVDLSEKWKEFANFRVTSFPESSDPDDLGEFDQIQDPRARKLLVGLRWLSKKGFIDGWDDVHYENIMVRPSTGEFVVSDVGEF